MPDAKQFAGQGEPADALDPSSSALESAEDAAEHRYQEGDAEDATPLAYGRANLPPWVIASREFQDHPRSLHIVGVRRENRSLFKVLERFQDRAERAQFFDEYMIAKFHLDEWRTQTAGSRRSIRNSYLRFLRGWGVDSSSIEGAVLKGWVESRLGIPPIYHRRRIEVGRQSYFEFARQRMLGHARTNAIDAQLDLLFEFTQYELRRRGISRVLLYRGTEDVEEQRILARRGKELLLQINNLCSFTSDVERAWEFGSTVFKVSVPAPRIFYFSGLLPKSMIQAEEEYLVIGGEHWVARVR